MLGRVELPSPSRLRSDGTGMVDDLVVLRTVVKNLSYDRRQRSRFFCGFGISFRLFQKQMILRSLMRQLGSSVSVCLDVTQ